MSFLTLGAALLAGVLTILNPCVLPILPIVFGSASNEHRYGPAALAAGLAIGFTLVGLFVATIGFSLGIDGDFFRTLSGGLLVLFGAVVAVPAAQRAFQGALAPVGKWASNRTAGPGFSGVAGQFGLGGLLGAVWSPCVGPTLGAATLLASQGEQLGGVALTMAVFGIGAALPLLLIGTIGRATMLRWRGQLGQAGRLGKLLLGGGMIFAGLLVLSGFDKRAETWAVEHSPDWVSDITTRF